MERSPAVNPATLSTLKAQPMIRISAMHSLLVPVLLPAMILSQVGCSGAAPGSDDGQSASDTSSTTATTRYDGQALFRGIFFGSGEVGQKFPEVWGSVRQGPTDITMSQEQIETALSGQIDRLTSTGNAQAVAQLSAIRDQVRSGTLGTQTTNSIDFSSMASDAKIGTLLDAISASDPTFFDTFAADIQSGDHVRIDAALDRSATKLLSLSGGVDNGGASKITGECAFIAVVVAIEAVAAIAIWVATKQAPKQQVANADDLGHDQFVDAIAHRLAL